MTDMTTSEIIGAAEGFGAVIALVGGYFLPTIIAHLRRHPSRGGIGLLNFFAFTVVFWIMALAWSLSHIETQAERDAADVASLVRQRRLQQRADQQA